MLPCRSANWRQEDDSSEAFGMSMNIAQIQAMAADLGARTLGQVKNPKRLQPKTKSHVSRFAGISGKHDKRPDHCRAIFAAC